MVLAGRDVSCAADFGADDLRLLFQDHWDVLVKTGQSSGVKRVGVDYCANVLPAKVDLAVNLEFGRRKTQAFEHDACIGNRNKILFSKRCIVHAAGCDDQTPWDAHAEISIG